MVYTCLFGYSEPFNDFTYDREGISDFICFTDDAHLRSDFWQIQVVPERMLDSPRAAKRIKLQPHKFLPEHSESLYVDNTVKLKAAPKFLFEAFLQPAQSPLVCFRHAWCNCVYDAAEEVIKLDIDDPTRVRGQMALYRRLGYPANNGLLKGCLLLRRHNDPALVPVLEHWFEQVLAYSYRDQLSLNPVAWLHGFSPTYIEADFRSYEFLDWPVIKPGAVRVPRGFDDERYLTLHPDVRAAGMSPRQHYTQFGAAEGRPYR